MAATQKNRKTFLFKALFEFLQSGWAAEAGIIILNHYPLKGLMSLPSFGHSPAFETDHKTASNCSAAGTDCLKSPSAEAKLNLPSSTIKYPKAHFLPCPLSHTRQLLYLSLAEGSPQQRTVISLAAPN